MTAADTERLDMARLRNLFAPWAPSAPAQPAPPGELAEYRHLLCDADPDDTTPAFVDIHHHTSTRRGNR